MNNLRKVRLLLQSDPSWVDRLTMALEIQGEEIDRTPQIEITYALAPQIEVTEPETGLFYFNSDSVSDEELMDTVSEWIKQRNLKRAEEAELEAEAELVAEAVSDESSIPVIETSPDLSSALYRIEDSLETIKMAVLNPEFVEEPPVVVEELPVLEEPTVLEEI